MGGLMSVDVALPLRFSLHSERLPDVAIEPRSPKLTAATSTGMKKSDVGTKQSNSSFGKAGMLSIVLWRVATMAMSPCTIQNRRSRQGRPLPITDATRRSSGADAMPAAIGRLTASSTCAPMATSCPR